MFLARARSLVARPRRNSFRRRSALKICRRFTICRKHTEDSRNETMVRHSGKMLQLIGFSFSTRCGVARTLNHLSFIIPLHCKLAWLPVAMLAKETPQPASGTTMMVSDNMLEMANRLLRGGHRGSGRLTVCLDCTFKISCSGLRGTTEVW